VPAEGKSGPYKAELERMTRLYNTLSQVNQAIVRLPNRQELFAQICRVAVEQGGFRLAFIGWIDARSLQVVPVAKFGNHTAYLDTAVMHADERPTGMGPTGRAIRSGKPYICNDYFNDPTTQRWRVLAAEHGFRASATFPIRENGVVRGVIVLYAGELGFFRDREIQLLEEAASDVSFALDNLAREEKRQKAEEAARQLAAIVETTSDAIVSESSEGTIQTWNAAAERMYGYTAEEAIGQSISLVVPPDLWPETVRMLAEVRAGRSFAGIETERLHKSGLRIPVAITLSPLRDGAGRIVGVSKIARDISEQNASLAALRESNGLLEIMINEVPTGLAMLDRDLRVLAASRRWNEDRGLTNIDVVGRSHEELFPHAPAHWKEQHQRTLAGETIVDSEDSFTRADGQQRWLRRTLRPWMTGTGEIGGLVILSEDITERKLADDARRRSEEFLRIFIEDTPVALAMFDRELRYLGANQYWRRDTGSEGELLTGRHRYEANPDIPPHWRDADRRALAGETVRCDEDLFVRRDQSLLWLRWEVRPWHETDGSVGGILIVAEDITERKFAEIAQHEAETQLRVVVDNLQDGLFVATPEGKLVTWNPAARRIYGIPEQGYETLALANYPEILTLYDENGSTIPLERWPMARILRGERVHNLELRSRSKFLDHDLILSYSGALVEVGNGRKLAFLRSQDVTARRQMEQELRTSQARFEAVVDSLDDGLIIVDADGTVLRWNPVVTRVVNFELGEKPGMRARDFLDYIDVLDAAGLPVAPDSTPMQRILKGEHLRGEVFKLRNKQSGHIYTFSYFGAIVTVESGSRLAFIELRPIAEEE